MTTLLVGFDSAWTSTNSGALVGALHLNDGIFRALAAPQIADYRAAERVVAEWQAEITPNACD
jgi:predicted RNase H-like nuclease